MIDRRNTENKAKKSLLERFLLILGFLFFMLYFVMGMGIIFWEKFYPNKEFPLEMKMNYRIAFGLLLIIYALYRATRFYKKATNA
ncbi:hypothetical protein D3C80_1206810 [compost metagenome]